MPRNAALACRLFSALTLIVGAPLACADQAAAQGDGYQDKTIQSPDGKTTVVRVMDSPGPRLHGKAPAESSDRYDPQNLDLGRTSSFSNKTFSAQDSALSPNSTAEEARGGHEYQTKSFSNSRNSDSTFGKKYQTTPFDSGNTSTAFTKTFATSSSKLTEGKDTTFASKTSEFQGVSSPLADSKKVPYAGFSDLGDKKFFDPAMTRIKHDPFAASNGLDVQRLSDLPNRPLTIDEVRNLINHETVPDLNSKPDAPSKPLNDPDYEPPVVAPMKTEDLRPPGPEEKDSGLPSPGMIADPASDSPGPLPK